MKKFEFTLGRMLDYQKQNLQKEKNIMGQYIEEKNECERQKGQIEAQLELIHSQMDAEIRQGTSIGKLKAYTAMKENGKRQLSGMKHKIELLNTEIERQREIVVEASREVTKLEKLKEKQLEEYRYAEAKEQENIVLEHVSAKYVRQNVS